MLVMYPELKITSPEFIYYYVDIIRKSRCKFPGVFYRAAQHMQNLSRVHIRHSKLPGIRFEVIDDIKLWVEAQGE